VNYKGQRKSVFTPVLLRVALQVGFLTLIIIFASLLLGLWLDRIFDSRPLFTILLLVFSMPVSWVAVFKFVNRAKKQLETTPSQPGGTSNQLREEAYRDED
jgi:F0F1-type ATP synthase assembly protein I